MHPFEKLRYKYEYGDCSIRELCLKYEFVVDQVERYAEEHGWEQKTIPDPLDIEEVNTFYSSSRSTLTILTAQRALLTWGDLIEIEDGILESAIKSAENLKDNPSPLDLSRLTKVYQTLMAIRQMYTEATLVPAITDRDLKSLLKESSIHDLNSLINMLQDRGIPIPEIGVDDIE
jgi:hypothetical protein